MTANVDTNLEKSLSKFRRQCNMKLNEHIKIFQNLPFMRGLRNSVIRMAWHLAQEHGEEITCESFIEAISKPVIVERLGKGKKQ